MNKPISKYFYLDTKTNCVKFIGDKLEVYINKRYEAVGLLSHTDVLETVGVFDMVIDGNIEGGMCLAAVITSRPSQTYTTTTGDNTYLVAVYNKDDIFISNNRVIRNDSLGYIFWNEFIDMGNIPKFITYDNITLLFDLIADVTGINFNVEHSVFEMIYAHIHRDPDDITREYRLSKMNKPAVIIPLRNVAYGPSTSSAKMLGSYYQIGLNSSLVNESDQTSVLDHILFS